MLCVIDIGNTNTVIGIYDHDRLIGSWRIRTSVDMTEDEFNLLVVHLFSQNHIDLADIDRTVISSVVPPAARLMDGFCRKYLHHPPRWVDASTCGNITVRHINPKEIGADRIINCIAAFGMHKTACIVIDFGTATTFDAVSEKGDFLGGAICPGIMISSEALFMKASKLPRVELLKAPDRAVGTNTADCIRSGLIFGYAGLVDGMVGRMKKEMASEPKIIATGGLADLMGRVSQAIDIIEPNLTLEGLNMIGQDLFKS